MAHHERDTYPEPYRRHPPTLPPLGTVHLACGHTALYRRPLPDVGNWAWCLTCREITTVLKPNGRTTP